MIFAGVFVPRQCTPVDGNNYVHCRARCKIGLPSPGSSDIDDCAPQECLVDEHARWTKRDLSTYSILLRTQDVAISAAITTAKMTSSTNPARSQ